MKKKKVKKDKTQPTIQEESFKDVEINHLKGQIEALKHYYAILIAKNVAKIEPIVDKLNTYLIAYREEDPTIEYSKEIDAIFKKLKKEKSPKVKKILNRQVELLNQIIYSHKSIYETKLKEHNELRQVI